MPEKLKENLLVDPQGDSPKSQTTFDFFLQPALSPEPGQMFALPQKVIRAIEVCLLARQPMSRLLENGRSGLRGFRVYKIGLSPARPVLYERINRRVEQMFATGLLDETRAMLARPDADQLKPLGAVGYRQACDALRGVLSVAEAIRAAQTATRHYAKRQLTWFRRETDVTWFEGMGNTSEVQQQILDWLERRLHPGTACAKSG